MSAKSRILNGWGIPRMMPGIAAPIRDKNGDVAKLHVLGPRRTAKIMRRIAGEKLTPPAKPAKDGA
jgi:hypothetical protein